jgi:hypothetical protein
MDEEELPEEEEHDDVYSEEGREDLVEGDEISPAEEGFMEGAHDGGQGAKCRKCGKVLTDDFIERRKGEDILRFCSEECSEEYLDDKD